MKDQSTKKPLPLHHQMYTEAIGIFALPHDAGTVISMSTDTEGLIETIDGELHGILDTDAVSSLMAETNTDGWDVTAKPFTISGHRYAVIDFTAKGEQKAESTFCGDTIFGKAIASVDDDGKVAFEILHAEAEDVRNPEDR